MSKIFKSVRKAGLLGPKRDHFDPRKFLVIMRRVADKLEGASMESKERESFFKTLDTQPLSVTDEGVTAKKTKLQTAKKKTLFTGALSPTTVGKNTLLG